MTLDSLPICVAALYHFTALDDLPALRSRLIELCAAQHTKGTLLLAREGINGTIAGSDAGVAAVIEALRALPGCAALEAKYSRAPALPFKRMKVRIKAEIVTMGQPGIDPLAPGHYVRPQDWNALITDPDTVVIDTRNDYEIVAGTFAGAINPGTRTFREFPDWFRQHRDELLGGDKPRKVAMFCTGGIRCEKSTAFLKAEGVDEVYHLQGGILKYLEDIPAAQSQWQGECFVFDDRVTVGHGLVPGSFEACQGCGRPLDAAARASALYIAGQCCANCHEQRRGTAGASQRWRGKEPV
ncbi:oxygen-dependent tRNA uridine(34) hydroxylase TrhO [Novosphingobium sp. B 225]|uniref:oxygen-dependent tRNA uridine(34) hydroxylase TrhO n=1 Tax=Novosphingobium sp. B 225 TaxID=1961849 RepID=UPI000B4B1AE2|nr:rhodanese-related sulfurtransferase [Novosphingobium sp. B 225]